MHARGGAGGVIMETSALFGLLLGLTVAPIALAALLGEWLNEQMRSQAGFKTLARDLGLGAGRSIILALKTWRGGYVPQLCTPKVPASEQRDICEIRPDWAESPP
jgi:hypothetical protein